MPEDWEELMELLISNRNWEILSLEQQMLPRRYDEWASKLLGFLLVYFHILPMQLYRDGNGMIYDLARRGDNSLGKETVRVLSLTREYLQGHEMCAFDLHNQAVMVVYVAARHYVSDQSD